MTGYLPRRLGTSLVMLFGVSVFVFFLLHTIYPSPAVDVLGPKANRVSIAAWNKQHGFDDPFIVQYLRYVNQLLHGNLGYSYKLNQSVAALFQERWARSAYLSGTSLLLAVLIATSKLPTIPHAEYRPDAKGGDSVWKHPNLVFGALGIFAYVGAEVSIGSFLVNYFGLAEIGGCPQRPRRVMCPSTGAAR